MSRIYLDTETVGLFGVPILLQWAVDDGPVIMHDIWKEEMGETMDLIEVICEADVIGFNLVFDHFMLSKIYTMFRLFGDRHAIPADHVQELGVLEERARFSNICIKPRRCCDIMLIARRGKFQALMARDPITIRRVPTILAHPLAAELEKRIAFDPIFFAKRKDPLAPKWKVFDITRSDGTIDPNFKNVKMRFSASSGLKNLYRHCFNVKEDFYQFADIAIDPEYNPTECGYAPYAKAMAPNAPKDWNHTWPEVIHHHIAHWYYREAPRKYASDDVIYTRKLHVEEFNSCEPGDTDSTLAAMVASARWHGFAIDVDKIIDLKKEALLDLKFPEDLAEKFKARTVTTKTVHRYGQAVMAAGPSKRYLLDAMNPEERLGFQGSTKKTVLQELVTIFATDDDGKVHEVAKRATEILKARKAKKQIEVYDKLILSRRFHASFKIGGALSNRMSGADNLNPQGIDHSKNIRACFPLADSSVSVLSSAMSCSQSDIERLIAAGELQITKLCGGDYKSFEVSLAARVFDDKKLNDFLANKGKIHAVFAMRLFPGKTYDEIVATDGAKDTRDLYDVGKKCLFAIFYGAEAFTLMDRQNIPEEIAVAAVNWLQTEYRGIGLFGEKIKNDFGALSQPNGIGTKVEWHDPKDYVESFLGFRRYFTLENKVMKALFELAQDVPKDWRDFKIKVQRRERVQTPSGAVASALYGAAFGIMSRNIRAAKNHCIQSPGADITKATQAAIWSIQPHGVHPWRVQTMNIHDEIMCSTAEGFQGQVEAKAKETVAYYKKTVPQLAIDWFSDISNWSSKKSGL